MIIIFIIIVIIILIIIIMVIFIIINIIIFAIMITIISFVNFLCFFISAVLQNRLLANTLSMKSIWWQTMSYVFLRDDSHILYAFYIEMVNNRNVLYPPKYVYNP